MSVGESNGTSIRVCDGEGYAYYDSPAQARIRFKVGGALGVHTVQLLGADGALLEELRFALEAETVVEDEGGRYANLYAALRKSLFSFSPNGESTHRWRGGDYRVYVHWILDHFHTSKGMQYLGTATGDLVDLLRETQREDGMIWSFANGQEPDVGFFETRDGGANINTRRDGGILFVRQPVENHCEANFVGAMYLAWKSTGDDEWMRKNLDAAMRALNYSVSDPARWSKKFSLLKRGYTIDSWDFQVEDNYTVSFPMGTDMLIDVERTKFGVFFGDNTGYAQACDELSEMLTHAGLLNESKDFRQRAADIRLRLNALAWNGRFYTHRVEEDPAVKRDLGVDEAAQVAMSNAYSINRGMDHPQAVAILRSYQKLQQNLPEGSPGEWYAIFPPFARGFGPHSERWQYMNGGVHGHAAGELARGAFEHGFEYYGVDILNRLRDLALKTDGMVHFAYTGAIDPPPAPQRFLPIALAAQANMDLCGQGAEGVPGWLGEEPENDMRNFPVGHQTFENVPYEIVDPAQNGRRGAIAVSCRPGFANQVEIPLNGKLAGAVYLLHAASGTGASKVCGAVTYLYEDGTQHEIYILDGTHLSGWWFPKLEQPNAGIAWCGTNPRSLRVGVSWAALTNPHPHRTIRGLLISAAGENKPVYAVLGLTLADRAPYHPPSLISTGGPDNWAGGTCMFALIQGLAGIRDSATRFDAVRFSPRWAASEIKSVFVSARYPASTGYFAYKYHHDPDAHLIKITYTGSGKEVELRVLLPGEGERVVMAQLNGQPIETRLEQVEKSVYATLEQPLGGVATLQLRYS